MKMHSLFSRLAILMLAGLSGAHAEFLRVEVAFQGTDCVSCTESLQGRLERVRGVETVELDLDRNVVTMQLEAGNKVRLTPLLSRITQDGTKISGTSVVVAGVVVRQDGEFRFQPAGLREIYRLELPKTDVAIQLQAGSAYEIRGTVSGGEAAGEPVIAVVSVHPVTDQ